MMSGAMVEVDFESNGIKYTIEINGKITDRIQLRKNCIFFKTLITEL